MVLGLFTVVMVSLAGLFDPPTHCLLELEPHFGDYVGLHNIMDLACNHGSRSIIVMPIASALAILLCLERANFQASSCTCRPGPAEA